MVGLRDHDLLRTRRRFVSMALWFGAMPWTVLAGAAEKEVDLPTEVAGITVPRSRIALRAAMLSRQSCPPFLFNHCMRTFLFGALALRRRQVVYRADVAFAAAALHDLGLLTAFASQSQSFEIDGADAAANIARHSGLNSGDVKRIWHSVALHDGRFEITRRSGPEAMLVALGAGSDVDGPDLATEQQRRQSIEILDAFPRLQFKQHFTALLVDHCHRKPRSQRGTWLEGLCREQVPGAWTDTTEAEIAAAPFDE